MKTLFIREDESRGVEILIESFQRIFRVFTYAGKLEIGPIRLWGRKEESGGYQGSFTIKDFKVEVTPDQVFVAMGPVQFMAERNKDVVINFGSNAKVSMRDTVFEINAAELNASEVSANIFNSLKVSSEKGVFTIGELLIKGCGNFVVQAADAAFRCRDFDVGADNAVIKAADTVNIGAVKGGLAMAGGTGVTISASPNFKKPTAGTCDVYAGMVNLGLNATSPAGRGEILTNILTTMHTSIVAMEAALVTGVAAGSYASTYTPATGKVPGDIANVTSKTVKVTP